MQLRKSKFKTFPSNIYHTESLGGYNQHVTLSNILENLNPNVSKQQLGREGCSKSTSDYFWPQRSRLKV